MDMTRCLLLDTRLESRLEGEAIAIANYLQNRFPLKSRFNPKPFMNWYMLRNLIIHC